MLRKGYSSVLVALLATSLASTACGFNLNSKCLFLPLLRTAADDGLLLPFGH